MSVKGWGGCGDKIKGDERGLREVCHREDSQALVICPKTHSHIGSRITSINQGADIQQSLKVQVFLVPSLNADHIFQNMCP